MAILLNRLLFAILLLAPLSVYWLPRFETTLEEDFLLLGIFLYSWLRVLNPQRKLFRDSEQIILLFFLFGVVYSIGWMGLIRGYGPSSGRILIVYPMALLIASITAPYVYIPQNRSYRVLIHLMLAVTIAVVGISFLSWWGSTTSFPFSTKTLLSSLLLFPILSSVGLLSRSIGQLNRVKGHSLLLIAITACVVVPWSQNISTYTTWFQAGELERAWTPFRFQDPEKIAEAKQKPLQAATYYWITHNRILKKGEIPFYLNWPFFLQYRMAYQAMRMENPPLCADYLSPSFSRNENKIEFIKNLWHQEFLNETIEHPPDYSPNQRVWVDFEYRNDNELFALDRWGRVYHRIHGVFIEEWETQQTFADAIDLELTKEFYVLRSSGEVVTSATTPLDFHLDEQGIAGQPIDLEFSATGETAFLITSQGEVRISGATPEIFPDFKSLRFYEDVIVDFELDPDGKGYYLLDQYGAIHSNHVNQAPTFPYRSPPFRSELLPYWPGQSMAKDLAVGSTGPLLYTRTGEIFLINQAYEDEEFEFYEPEQTWPFQGTTIKYQIENQLNVFLSNGQEIILPLAN